MSNSGTCFYAYRMKSTISLAQTNIVLPHGSGCVEISVGAGPRKHSRCTTLQNLVLWPSETRHPETPPRFEYWRSIRNVTAQSVAQGHTDNSRLLLDCCENVDVRDPEDQTALHLAAEGGFLDVIRNLWSAMRISVPGTTEDGHHYFEHSPGLTTGYMVHISTRLDLFWSMKRMWVPKITPVYSDASCIIQ